MSAAPAPAVIHDSPYAARWSAAEHHLEVAAYDDGVVLVTLSQPERRNAMSDGDDRRVARAHGGAAARRRRCVRSW